MVRTKLLTLLGALAVSLGSVLITAAPASAVEVKKICSGDCDTLRAVFYDSALRYSGDRIEYYGGSPCSATNSDADFSLSVLPSGWNDRISSIEDFHSCDVNLYWDGKFKGESTGYVNYGDADAGGGKHLSLRWSNDASSFRVS